MFKFTSIFVTSGCLWSGGCNLSALYVHSSLISVVSVWCSHTAVLVHFGYANSLLPRKLANFTDVLWCSPQLSHHVMSLWCHTSFSSLFFSETGLHCQIVCYEYVTVECDISCQKHFWPWLRTEGNIDMTVAGPWTSSQIIASSQLMPQPAEPQDACTYSLWDISSPTANTPQVESHCVQWYS